jgi:hypothetical protein
MIEIWTGSFNISTGVSSSGIGSAYASDGCASVRSMIIHDGLFHISAHYSAGIGAGSSLKGLSWVCHLTRAAAETFGRLHILKFNRIAVGEASDIVIEDSKNVSNSRITKPETNRTLGLIVSVSEDVEHSLRSEQLLFCARVISRLRPSTTGQGYRSLHICGIPDRFADDGFLFPVLPFRVTLVFSVMVGICIIYCTCRKCL